MNSTEINIDDGWYGSSYPWFFGFSITLGVLISVSNGLVIWIAVRTKNIRAHTANWFVVALAVADFVFGFDKIIFLPFAFTFADKYPILCALEGCVHFTSGVVAVSAPAMMAACRYYTISDGVENFTANNFARVIFFTKQGALCLIAGCWLYFFFITGFLLGFNQMGKSPDGFCGTKPFSSIPLYAFFIIGFLSFVYMSTIATIVYSTKLTRFMKKHNARNVRSEETNETKALLKVIKIAAAQPFVLQFTPVFIFFLADLGIIPLPIALGRILALIFALAALVDPWLTILILRPFRKEFQRRFVAKIVKQRASITTTVVLRQPTMTESSRMRVPAIFIHRASE